MKNRILAIYHSNDMHARLSRMSQLSHMVKRMRAEDETEGLQTVYWDAGDAADRRNEICSLTLGAAFPDLLNEMGVEIQTVGNALSLTYGPQVLEAYAARADFPFLAANLRNGLDGELVRGVQETAVIQPTSDLKIGVFGLTDPWDGSYRVFGLDMPPSVLVAQRLTHQLRELGCRIIILLSHLGLLNDRIVASEADGIDLIIGSHTHDLLPEGELVNGCLIAQAGDYAEHLGKVTLEISSQTGRIVAKSAEVLPVPQDEPQDIEFERALRQLEETIAQTKEQIIGELPGPLPNSHISESRMGNFAADALCDYMQADAAVLMSGLLRDGLETGPVTLGDFNHVCFTTANPFRSKLLGVALKAALERALDPERIELMLPSFRGSPVGFPQISGLEIEFDPSQPQGNRIGKIYCGGERLDLKQEYIVAHTDAETMRDVGYFDPTTFLETAADIPTILPTVIRDYLKQAAAYEKTKPPRWVVING